MGPQNSGTVSFGSGTIYIQHFSQRSFVQIDLSIHILSASRHSVHLHIAIRMVSNLLSHALHIKATASIAEICIRLWPVNLTSDSPTRRLCYWGLLVVWPG